MPSFWDLFNGSKFYSKRAQYRREYFTAAKALVEKHNIPAQLETTHTSRELTELEKHRLASEEGYLEILKAKELAGTLGSCEVVLGVVKTTRLGLRYFTDALAEHTARAETSYAMDLVSPALVASWIAGFIITTATAWLTGGGAVLAFITGVVATLMSILTSIQALGHGAAMQALHYKTYDAMSATSVAYAHTSSLGGRKALQEGTLDVFNGLSNYANQPRYKAYSPGSETFRPTQGYTPSFAQTKQQPEAHLKALDEQTQGRAHYDLAGNAGAFAKINPKIPLASTQELENDILYKQNAMKAEIEKMLEGLRELSSYLGSTQEHKGSAWLQKLIDELQVAAENTLHTYTQSKDFIENSRRYNQALRFNKLPYSVFEAKKQAKEARIEINDPYGERPPSPPKIDESPMDPIEEQNNRITLKLHQDLLAQGLDDESACALSFGLENESPEQKQKREETFKQAKITYLKALSPAKFVKAYKSYVLLTECAEDVAKTEQALDVKLFEPLQENYINAYDEVLAHKVLCKLGVQILSGAYEPQAREKLGVWVQFQGKHAFGDYYYPQDYVLSPILLVQIDEEFGEKKLKYAKIWGSTGTPKTNMHNQHPAENDNSTKELYAAYQACNARSRELWKVTPYHHNEIYFFTGKDSLKPLYAHLEEYAAAGAIFTQGIEAQIKAL